MSKWIVDIHGEIEGDYELIKKYEEREPQSPCDLCRYSPPSSMDGKPCAMCPAEGREE